MRNPFIDLETGEMGFSLYDNMLMDFDGDLLMKMSDNMAMDLDSGELHIINSFGSSKDEKDDW